MASNEIRRGDFVYRDTFFVDLGGDRRHPRASISELKDVLLPKKRYGPPNDHISHWYEAQLLHYGLPRTKDKNAAKVRLTTAITSGSLAVPAYITRMEADMKKEFAAASRKARVAATKTQSEDVSTKHGRQSEKRKTGSNDDIQTAGSSSKISVTIGNITFNVDHQEGAVDNSKKRKIAVLPAEETPTGINTDLSKKKHATTPNREPSAVQVSRQLNIADVHTFPSMSTATTMAKQTARNSTSTPVAKHFVTNQAMRGTYSVGTSSSSQVLSYPPSMHEHEPLDFYDQDDDDCDQDDAPPSYDSHNFNSKPCIQISGRYGISTGFEYMDCELTIVKDLQTSQFWAHFVAAEHRGVFHFSGTDDLTSQQPVRFNWRAEDLSSGQLRFKRDQEGWIQFDGEGGVRGCWFGLLPEEDLEFDGELESEPDVEVYELMEQWEWFVKTAYGR